MATKKTEVVEEREKMVIAAAEVGDMGVVLAQGELAGQGQGSGAIAGTIDDMFSAYAGQGLEEASGKDYAIPYISILQKGSPQVSRANAKFIQGAMSGMFMNTVTGELYDGEAGILVVPCFFKTSLVEWNSRDSGGGLVAHHADGDPILATCKENERGQMVAPSGTLIIDTAYHFVLHLKDGGFPEWAVISMASTQKKKSRTWNSVMKNAMRIDPRSGRPYAVPTFGQVFRMTTVGETKDQYDWFGWKIVAEGLVESTDLFKAAVEYSIASKSGAVKVSAQPSEFEDASNGNGGATSEVPF